MFFALVSKFVGRADLEGQGKTSVKKGERRLLSYSNEHKLLRENKDNKNRSKEKVGPSERGT